MTQQELANRAGARRETISRLEKGSTILHRTLPWILPLCFPCRWNRCFCFTTTAGLRKNGKNALIPSGRSFKEGLFHHKRHCRHLFFPVTEPYEIDCAQQKLYNSGSRRCQPHAEQRDRLHPAHDPRHWNPHKKCAYDPLDHDKSSAPTAVKVAHNAKQERHRANSQGHRL